MFFSKILNEPIHFQGIKIFLFLILMFNWEQVIKLLHTGRDHWVFYNFHIGGWGGNPYFSLLTSTELGPCNFFTIPELPTSCHVSS